MSEKNFHEKLILRDLVRKQYGVYGNSAVQICLWTKKAIRAEGVCYKQKFYGISCLQCMQFSPFIFCQENCIHCWRPKELLVTNIKKIMKMKAISPEKIIDNLVEKRKKLLIGFLGNKKVKKARIKKALKPIHFAISLVGDPLLYSNLPEMIKLLKKRYKARSIFIVTNCQEPKALQKLIEKNTLPTQLYLSIIATNEEDYLKLKRPLYRDAWQRFLNFLKVARKIKKKCKKVLRYTLIKGINDNKKNISELKKIINTCKPDFIEVKGYMHLGYSTLRLRKENMPYHSDVKEFVQKLLKEVNNFRYNDEDKASRIVLISKT
ncbi:MAG: 4-demethylwyosine synthase TYW1 [Candidatus Pacearchaeota archaeon]